MKLSMSQKAAQGLFFVVLGSLGWILGREMPIGTAGDMGVGYVPRMLSYGCIGVGIILFSTAIIRREARAAFGFAGWPLLIVTALVVAFGLLLPRLGLPLTIVAIVLAAGVSGETFDWRVLAATALTLALFSTLLFHTLLRLQVPVWPSW